MQGNGRVLQAVSWGGSGIELAHY